MTLQLTNTAIANPATDATAEEIAQIRALLGVSSFVSLTTTGNYTLTTAATTRLTLDANRQLSMPASPGAVSAGFVLILNCGGFTPTWSGVTWLTPGGTAPVLNTVAGKENLLTFVWDGVASLWLGTFSGSEA
jgi:hypothetical protein